MFPNFGTPELYKEVVNELLKHKKYADNFPQ